MQRVSVDHYENFPVASVLCPAPLRAPIVAIYWFARTADDIADEGEAPPEERLRQLARYRTELHSVASGAPPQAEWRAVFEPLARALRSHALPVPLLDALLSAFEQDVMKNRYADRAELLDYCARSANPVGRLLLHLHGVAEPAALRQSDAICSALQLINFWQDLSVDTPRGRLYLPASDCARHGAAEALVMQQQDTPQLREAVADVVRWSRELMLEGAPLAHRLPGRSGLELRLVVQGGLRILEKIEKLNHGVIHARPALGKLDALPMLWRALLMRRPASTPRSILA